MVRIWSELPGARLKEQVADLGTVAVARCSGAASRGSSTSSLAAFAEAGRIVRSGGETMIDSGRSLGEALAGVPLVGSGLQDVASNAFAGAGVPLSDFGSGIEDFILLVAAVLALLLALVTLVPWLTRYVPWRWERLRRTRAGHRAIRRAPEVAEAACRGGPRAARRHAPGLRHAARVHARPTRRLGDRSPRPPGPRGARERRPAPATRLIKRSASRSFVGMPPQRFGRRNGHPLRGASRYGDVARRSFEHLVI